jgi:hypothetical protein
MKQCALIVKQYLLLQGKNKPEHKQPQWRLQNIRKDRIYVSGVLTSGLSEGSKTMGRFLLYLIFSFQANIVAS